MIRTLVARGLITEAGHDAESGAVVFATTPYFLERMGLRLLDEPPSQLHPPEVAELENELRQFATPGPEPMDMSLNLSNGRPGGLRRALLGEFGDD